MMTSGKNKKLDKQQKKVDSFKTFKIHKLSKTISQQFIIK